MRPLLALAVLFVPAMAVAHTGEPPEPHDLWSAWSFEPGIVLSLAAAALLYYRGSQPSRSTTRFERWSFWSGFTVLTLALVSPLHTVGSVLFSVHMAQHEIMMLVAAPLLVLARPLVPFLRGLPFSWRRALGHAAKTNWIEGPWHAISAPLPAWTIHLIALWLWHLPSLFDATLQSDAVHSLQHACFFGSAMLFWWSLVGGRERRLRAGIAVLYVFTTAVHTSLLGALVTFAPVPLYPAYRSTVAWGLTALQDQQIGGLIMWVPGGVVFTVAGLVLFARWLREPEARVAPSMFSALAVVCILVLNGAGCSRAEARRNAAQLTGGDPIRGQAAITSYGCPACHTIPGIAGARGLVGPPLTGFASRVYIGGVLPNTPQNVIRWIENPKAVDDKTAMPNMNIPERDARDIAGYLYTLR